MKRLFLAIILCVSTALAFAMDSEPKQIIAWDWNDTLANSFKSQDAKAMIPEVHSYLWKNSLYRYVPLFIGDVIAESVKNYTSKKVWGVERTESKTYCVDDVVDRWIRKYPSLEPHRQQFYKFSAPHTLNPQMAAIVIALHNNGYKDQLVATNAGDRAMKVIQEKYPHFFQTYMKEAYAIGTKDQSGQLYTIRDKKSVEYFVGLRKFLADMKYNVSERIFFIDDRAKNIEIADASNQNQSQKILALRFLNEQKLWDDLLDAGMLPGGSEFKDAFAQVPTDLKSWQ